MKALINGAHSPTLHVFLVHGSTKPHLDSYEVVQEPQYEHLGRVEAAVCVAPLRDQRVEVLAVLREPIRDEDWVT